MMSQQQKQGEIEKEVHQLEQNSTQQKKQHIDQNQKKGTLMPKKMNYKKVRAHLNPLDDTHYPYPMNPSYVNWQVHFPKYFNLEISKEDESKDEFKNFLQKPDPMQISVNTTIYPNQYNEKAPAQLNGTNKSIDFLDVGCGFGGLLFALGESFPEKLSFGIEIRGKLVDYIGEKIRAFRIEQNKCHNISVLRTNSMRHFIQYFRKASVEKIFFGFPDPHFKAKNFRRRIVNLGFLSEYAYALKKGGRIYCITDVPDLHEWHVEKLQLHTQFRVMDESELKDDIAFKLIFNSSEESQKVDRHNCAKYAIVAERI